MKISIINLRLLGIFHLKFSIFVFVFSSKVAENFRHHNTYVPIIFDFAPYVHELKHFNNKVNFSNFILRWANHEENHKGRTEKVREPGLPPSKYTRAEKAVFDVYHVDPPDQFLGTDHYPRYFTIQGNFHPFHAKNGRDSCRVWRYEPESLRFRNRLMFFYPDEFLSTVDYHEWADRY